MYEKEIDNIVENMSVILPILGKVMLRGIKAKTSYPPHVIGVMGALHHHGKLTMTGIGNHLQLPKPQITTLIDKLVSDNLVERLNDENDRRVIYIQLTESGDAKFSEIKDLMSESLRIALNEIDQTSLLELEKSSSTVAKLLIEINLKQQASCCCNNSSPQTNE